MQTYWKFLPREAFVAEQPNVTWELTVKKVDDKTCEFTNHVKGRRTPEFYHFIGKSGVPFEQAKAARTAAFEAHNAQETPTFRKEYRDNREHVHTNVQNFHIENLSVVGNNLAGATGHTPATQW